MCLRQLTKRRRPFLEFPEVRNTGERKRINEKRNLCLWPKVYLKGIPLLPCEIRDATWLLPRGPSYLTITWQEKYPWSTEHCWNYLKQTWISFHTSSQARLRAYARTISFMTLSLGNVKCVRVLLDANSEWKIRVYTLNGAEESFKAEGCDCSVNESFCATIYHQLPEKPVTSRKWQGLPDRQYQARNK